MAVQSSFYNVDGTTKTFPSTKHIASSQHVAVWFKRVVDNIWEISSTSDWTLVNNSVVFTTAPFTYLYSQIEVRVADEADELEDSPTDVALVAANMSNINILADNIDLLSSNVNNEYIVSELPTTATEGDIAVNVVDGGIYEYINGTWVLIGTSGGGTTSTDVIVPIEAELPVGGTAGEFIFNTADGLFYAYIDGTWQTVVAPPSGDIGIKVYATNPTVDLYEGLVIFNTTLNQLLKYTNGAWVQVVEPTTAATEVADGSITIAKFASGIRPIEIVDLLPTVGNVLGRLVYLTTDGKVYRYTATGFTAAVPTVDLTGQITTTQITDDAITTAKITAGAITATEIATAAITSDHITANSITTGMIQAGAIGATQIAASAITTDKIYAGSVVASKIAAGSIDATKIVAGSIGATQLAANSVIAGKIAAGAVSTDQLAANCVTANQIAAGAVTASKLTVDALDGKSAAFSGARSYTGGGYWCISANGVSAGGIHAEGTSNWGVVGKSSSSSGGVLGYTTTGAVGVKGESSGYAVWGECTGSTGQWGLITFDKTYSAGGYSPFTGSHIVYSKDTLKQGELVHSVDAWVVDVDNSLVHVAKTTKSNEKRVIGVVSCANDTLLDNIYKNKLLCDVVQKNKIDTPIYTIKSKFKPYVDYMIENKYKEVEINSVGEGAILVCNENGNIDNGDYLTSSNLAGYAMKQDTDALHNYTVAKALESVDWSKETDTTKMIACTYHCG